MANVPGTGGNDTLNGSTTADSVSGFAGNDSIIANGGNDTIFAGAGNDTVFGGAGNDVIEADLDRVSTWGYRVYDRNFSSDNGQAFTIESGTLRGSGLATDFNLINQVNAARGSSSSNPEDFGIIYTATFTATTAGTYTFRTTSDDGSTLRLLNSSGAPLTWNSQSTGQTGLTFLNNDFHQAATTRQGSVTLAAGESYTIEIRVWENAGQQVLSADFQLPGSTTWNSLTNNTTHIGTGVYTGNDVIDGGAGNDSINGGAGDDSLIGGTGLDTIFGGSGNDTLDGGDDADRLFGGDGADVILGGGGNDLIEGGAGDDSIDGGDGADTIVFGAGNDTVFGGAGDDVIDDISGTILTGTNLLYGGAGNDTIWAGDGNDTLFGDADNDQLSGEGDDDVLYGGAGIDTLYGGTGNDSLFGGDGADILFGDDGNDTLFGGGGADQLFGGAGQDSIVAAGDASDFGDFIDGGDTGTDEDVLDLSAWGWAGTNIIYDPNDSENGTVQFLDSFGNVVGTLTFADIETVVPCFTPGTDILTPFGPRKIETLVEGDLVLTRDHGVQPIRWIGQKRLSLATLIARPALCPIRLPAGSLGPCAPARDLIVSPQHRMLIEGSMPEVLFGETEVLVAARHLAGQGGIGPVLPRGVTYIHMLFDQHEIILANGCWTESFQPGAAVLNGMEDAQRDEVLDLFPELAGNPKSYTAARPSLLAHEARVLLAA